MSTFALSSSALASATFVGNILTVPEVVVGEELYYLELSLSQSGGNIDFAVAGAQKVVGLGSSDDVSIFNGTTLVIPKLVIGPAGYALTLGLVSSSPPLFRLSAYSELDISTAEVSSNSGDDKEGKVDAQNETSKEEPSLSIQEQVADNFEKAISQQIVMRYCVVCHVQGGASGYTDLVFKRGDSESTLAYNLDQFKNFRRGNDLILAKVSGSGHGGGTVLPLGSAAYESLSDFLSLLKESQN